MTEPAPAAPFFVPGGTLPRDAPCYVERTADSDLLEHLLRGDFCYILTARQMGKSSLMVRTADRLRRYGVAVAILDLTALGQNLTPEQWYLGQIRRIARHLDLEEEAVDYWLDLDPAEQSPFLRWQQTLREALLERCPGNLVLFIDEIDVVRSLPFSTDEFFAGIRECYNRRADDPAMGRLTFCLLGVATPSDLIQDVRTTPFNIGHRIDLRDLTERDARGLTPGLVSAGKSPGQADALLERTLYWTGGHPFLTQRLCLALAEDLSATGPEAVDHWCERLFLSQSARQRDDNLLFVGERLLRGEVDLATLLTVYRRLLTGRRPVHDDGNSPSFDLLRLAGLVTRDESGFLSVRNPIYRRVFDTAWVDEHLPDAELKRQRRAYRRSLMRIGSLAASLVLIFATITGFAIRERNRAEAARESKEDSAFMLSTSNASSAYAKGNFQRLSEIAAFYGAHPGYRNRAEVGVLRYLAQANLPILDYSAGQPFFDILALSADRHRDEITLIFGNGLLQTFHAGNRSQAQGFLLTDRKIQTAAFNADGSLLALSQIESDDGTPGRVVVYRQRDQWSGTALPLTGVSALRFLADNRLIAVHRSGRQQEVTLVDPTNPAARRVLLSIRASVRRVATDGARYVVCVVSKKKLGDTLGSDAPTQIHVFDLVTGARRVIDTSVYRSGIVDLKMIPGTRQMVVAFRDRRLRFWDVTDGRSTLASVLMSSPILCLSATEDGSQIFTGHVDHTIQSWRIDPRLGELRLVDRYIGHKEPVLFATTASPRLFSVSRSEVFQWKIVGKEAQAPVRNSSSVFLGPTFYSVDVSMLGPDSLPMGRTFEHYPYGSDHASWRSNPVEQSLTAYAPNGRYLAIVKDAHTRLLTLDPNGKPDRDTVLPSPVGQEHPLSLSFSPDSRMLTVLYESGRVIRHDLNSDKQENWTIPFKRPVKSPINTCSYSADGRWLCTVFSDQDSTTVDLLVTDLFQRSTRHLVIRANLVNDTAISPDGRTVALLLMNNPSEVFRPSRERHTNSGPLLVVDVETGNPRPSSVAQVNSESRIRFSDDGKTIVVMVDPYRIIMLDSNTLTETLNLDNFEMGLKYKRLAADSKSILSLDESNRLKEIYVLP